MIICENCKKQLNDDANVCDNCGSTLSQKEKPRKAVSARCVAIGVGTILIICLLIGIFFLMNPSSDNATPPETVSNLATSENSVSEHPSPEEYFQSEITAYLGQPRDDVLSYLDSYEHFGPFEGADFYTTDELALGFEPPEYYERKLCISVNGDLKLIFPKFFENPQIASISKDDFNRAFNVESILVDDPDFSGDRNPPFLMAMYKNFHILVGCDSDGNVTPDSWCEVDMK